MTDGSSLRVLIVWQPRATKECQKTAQRRSLSIVFCRYENILKTTIKPCILNPGTSRNRSKVTCIQLENPTNRSICLRPRVTNPEVFTLHRNASSEQLALLSAQHSVDCEVRSRICSHRSVNQSDWDVQLPISRGSLQGHGELEAMNSRPKSTVILDPKSCVRLGVKFTPYALGELGHDGQIEFLSDEVRFLILFLWYLFFKMNKRLTEAQSKKGSMQRVEQNVFSVTKTWTTSVHRYLSDAPATNKVQLHECNKWGADRAGSKKRSLVDIILIGQG